MKNKKNMQTKFEFDDSERNDGGIKGLSFKN